MRIGMTGGRRLSRSSTWMTRRGWGHELGLGLFTPSRTTTGPPHLPSSAFHDVYDMMNPRPEIPSILFFFISSFSFVIVAGVIACSTA